MMLDNETFFEFQLARELHMMVAELREMPAAEFMQWQAFFKAEAARNEVKGG